MKFKRLLVINSIVFIGAGIAFCLYAPLVLAVLFQITQIEGIDTIAYWYLVSFARLAGAAIFALGLLLWTSSNLVDNQPNKSRLGLLYSLIIGYVVGIVTLLTQQVSIWQNAAGWILIAVCVVFLIGYGYIIFKEKDSA